MVLPLYAFLVLAFSVIWRPTPFSSLVLNSASLAKTTQVLSPRPAMVKSEYHGRIVTRSPDALRPKQHTPLFEKLIPPEPM